MANNKSIQNEQKIKCGIIMPISANDAGTAEHWSEVYTILKDVFSDLGYDANLVSETDESTIIQKTIIQNIYNCDIVVCDISSKNPNVMFELGMRLAFDKPTIIIKDDKTEYIFDTGVIEHIGYPRDLRFPKIIEFKEKLKFKTQATLKKSHDDPSYSTFLKNFGQYKVATLEEKEVSSNEFVLAALADIRHEISRLRRDTNSPQVFKGPKTIGSFATFDAKVEDLLHKYVLENNININSLSPSDPALLNYITKGTIMAELLSKEELIRTVDTVITNTMVS